MAFDSFIFPALIFLCLAALIILLSHDWRLTVSAMGLLFIGVFVLVAISWPIEMAVVKLVAGWISSAILGLGLVNRRMDSKTRSQFLKSEIVFRVSASILIGLVVISISPAVMDWLPNATREQTLGGLILLGMGMLHLGFPLNPFRTAVGLMVFLAGFEIIYATIESSILVAGFLAIINLGLSLVAAYLFITPTMENGS